MSKEMSVPCHFRSLINCRCQFSLDVSNKIHDTIFVLSIKAVDGKAKLTMVTKEYGLQPYKSS